MKEALASMPPAYFALVMATGIISIACHYLDLNFLALPLFWLNLLFYFILWVLLLVRLFFYPKEVKSDLVSHTAGVGFFTLVAGTTILGSQVLLFLKSTEAALGFWFLALALWFFFMYAVLTAFIIKAEKPSLQDGIDGSWLLIVVAIESLSVLGASLARHGSGNNILIFVALTLYLLGGVLYSIIVGLIFYRLAFFRLQPSEFKPTYWIITGSEAISTLAGAILLQQRQLWPLLDILQPFLLGGTLLFWAVATGWLPLLFTLETWSFFKRPIQYKTDYWGLVFPLGMYTACTFKISQLPHLDFLAVISHYFIYLALAAWTITFVGLLKSLSALVWKE